MLEQIQHRMRLFNTPHFACSIAKNNLAYCKLVDSALCSTFQIWLIAKLVGMHLMLLVSTNSSIVFMHLLKILVAKV